MRRSINKLWLVILLATIALASGLTIEFAREKVWGTSADNQFIEVPYVPTPNNVVEEMLKVANVGKDDVVYDLGCGDGRIVITAAQKYGARGVGVDINPDRIKESNENAQKAGVADRVRFLQQDLFETDLREATVVTLYLLPDVNRRLRPKMFQELKPGTRVVSHAFDMGEWNPEKVIKVPGADRERTIYYWVISEANKRSQ
jgi:tRNA G37 N-methylase Trm5